MVHFVGAGPGACDLITVRGMNRIKEADVIIYAGSLVNPELLQYAKPDCEIYNSAGMTLEEVICVMCRAEENGKTTVRLHTGDPSVYGAIREQMDCLSECHIAYDVCPGVSAVFGAAASLACEYTLPDVTQTLILTRAEGKTPVPEKENLRSLSSHRASLVLYLSSGLARKVRQELLAGGYEENDPVAVVYKATWPDEKIVPTTVGHLPEDMEKAGISKTALIIVSPVLGATYAKSRLYDAAFSTEYRGATKLSMPQGIRKLLLLTCSKQGYHTMNILADKLEKIEGTTVIKKVRCEALPDVSMKETVKSCVRQYFGQVDAMVFVTACGIAVRSVAENLTHKSKDPAIVCMDECGKHVISLVSGHAGGANALTRMIADCMWATPVITTATDVEGRFSIDDYAREHHLVVTDWEKAKQFSAQVLAGHAEYDNVIISPETVFMDDKKLQLIPQCAIAGIGCKKGTAAEAIACAVSEAFSKAGLREESLFAVASIDLKKDEAGLCEFCRKQDVPFVTYAAEELNAVAGTFSASEFVEKMTGVDNICERSAVKYAMEYQESQNGTNQKKVRLIVPKQTADGVTVALAMIPYEHHFKKLAGETSHDICEGENRDENAGK